jgi:hypothetical protein
MLNSKRKGRSQLRALRFLIGRNVLIDYYIYRRCIEVSLYFTDAVLEDVFEGGLEGMGEGIDLRAALKLQSLVGSSSGSILIARR